MANMLNARKIGNELNVFAGLFDSHVFWVIWVLICGFQVGRPPPLPGRLRSQRSHPGCLPALRRSLLGSLPARVVK